MMQIQPSEVDNEQRSVDKAERMKSGSIPRLVMSFASATLIALVLNSVYNLTDTLFVSWGVGNDAMGGVSVVFPFVILQGAISTAIGGGAASIVSRKLGENKVLEASEVTFNAMLTFYITAVITTVLGFAFMTPLLHLMGVTDELLPYAKEYFTIVLIGNVFSTGFSSIIRAEGKILYGVLIWVIPITINIILDAVFILGLGWGVRGSALATVACQFVSFSMSVVFFTKFTSLSWKCVRLKLHRIGEILAIGIPSLVQMGSISIMTLVLNNVLRTADGTTGVTTFGYMSKIITFALVPLTAIAQALSPIVGYNYGAGKLDRVNKTITFCALVSLAYSVVATAVAFFIPHLLLRIFTNDTAIVATGARGIRIIAASVVLTPLPMLVAATLQAEGKKLWSLILYASNLVFLTAVVFFMQKRYGLDGVWYSYVLASACSTVLAVVKLLVDRRRSVAELRLANT